MDGGGEGCGSEYTCSVGAEGGWKRWAVECVCGGGECVYGGGRVGCVSD